MAAPVTFATIIYRFLLTLHVRKPIAGAMRERLVQIVWQDVGLVDVHQRQQLLYQPRQLLLQQLRHQRQLRFQHVIKNALLLLIRYAAI